MTEKVVEAEFKTTDRWDVADVIRQIGKFKPEDLSNIVVIYTMDDGTIGVLGSENTVEQRVGTLEIAKVMSMSSSEIEEY